MGAFELGGEVDMLLLPMLKARVGSVSDGRKESLTDPVCDGPGDITAPSSPTSLLLVSSMRRFSSLSVRRS